MLRPILQRLLGMLVVMLIVVTIVFIITRLIPGNPAAVMLGQDATAEDIARLKRAMGLDQPMLVQYLNYMGSVLQGDLGQSIFLGQPVLSALLERAEPTFFLTLFSLLVAVTISLPIGIYAAYRYGSVMDQASTSLAMVGVSIPSFWLGLILIQVFAVQLGWFPASGYGGPNAGFATRLWHLILPSIALGTLSAALITRFVRASMLDVLNEDYIRTARSKGMNEPRVVLRHALKNAMIPILTVIGLTTAILISGAVVIETVFNLPGIGNLVVNAVLRRDYPVIQGALLVISGMYVLINLTIDLLYVVIDPRVRA